MPAPQLCRIPFNKGTLETLARDLLAAEGRGDVADLSSALVLLPSARACRTLGHLILEAGGHRTRLLPRVQTLSQWSSEMITAAGVDPNSGPDPRLRALILAPALAELPWLADNPESAPGLARELIAFFDEARLHNQAGLLFDSARLGELQAMTSPAEADVLRQDMTRVQDAWALYRRRVPRDGYDQMVDLAAALAADPPRPVVPPAKVIVAAFARIDPTRAALLKAALATGESDQLYLAEAAGPLARHFLATWGSVPAATDPLAPSRQIQESLTGVEPEITPAAPTLRARLDALAAAADPADFLAPRGPLRLVPCGGAEVECRFITDQVVTALREADGNTPRITIAVNDATLAARLRAHLKEAGLDCDDTHGDPLSSLPAGLLVRFILRAALTDLRIEPLLEVLTHPYVQLPMSEGGHGIWTLRLEQMYRRDRGPRGGLAVLHRRADERDAAALNLFRDYRPDTGAGMVAFVTRIADAFAPLLPFGDGRPRPWRELVTALRESWGLLAPKYGLADARKSRPDIGRLDDLFSQLTRDTGALPAATLAEFSSEMGRLLAGENAAAHRKPYLPVVIAGLVEARLERPDLLIIAGLRDGVFPKKSERPLFLSGALRERLGMPGWSDALARDAELFTRLLHGAPRVVLTWSSEEGGNPALPSPFVSRLQLFLPQQAADPVNAPQWRTAPVPWDDIAAEEDVFREAEEDVPALVPIRPLTRLSWSALSKWRDCRYRALLERGFALHREEEVQEEFRAMDYGQLVHRALQDWLEPTGPGYAALAAGEAPTAEAALAAAAEAHFTQGQDELPQRRLWLDTFRAAFEGLVGLELARFRDWRPIALERQFELGLGDLRTWLEAEAGALGTDLGLGDAPGHVSEVVLRGTVDRVDLAQDGTGAVSVIDYKTGKPPSVKAVAELEEMQILLYAAAAEMGALALPGGATRVSEGFYYEVTAAKQGWSGEPHLAGTSDEGRDLLLRGGAQLVDLATIMSDPAATYPVLPRERKGSAPTRLPCHYCDLRGVCRVEELVLPAGTERKLDQLVGRKDQG